MLFRRLFFCALLVGLCAGLVHSAVQRWQVVPTIAAAEVFEQAAEAAAPTEAPKPHDHAAMPPHDHLAMVERDLAARQSFDQQQAQAHDSAHDHDAGAWAPADGAERTVWTVIANVLASTGFALMLLPALAFWDRTRGGAGATWRTGLLWGAAGWLCVYLWPSLGLPPALPGEAEAPLQARQAWWLLAVVSAAGGLALLALARGKLRWAGLALLALPFIVGAPHLDGSSLAGFGAEAAAQMHGLKDRFVVATAVSTAVHWLVLGALAAVAVARWLRPLLGEGGPAGALRRRASVASVAPLDAGPT